MASLRYGTRKDGSAYTQVLYRHEGKQRSSSFDDHREALKFRDLVDQLGPDKAREIARLTNQATTPSRTVAEWVAHYIDHLTGIDPRTVQEYRGYLRADIGPALGVIPLAVLTRDDIARWVQAMSAEGFSGKTIANKHALLSAALSSAVKAGHIDANPAAGARLPRTERLEMLFLTREQFALLHSSVTKPWRPFVEFLVASGARIGEATALKPGDVDRDTNTVRISRAWKRGGGGYRVGPPKTAKSRRTINVPASVLDKLDYSGEWLFTTPGNGGRAGGGPVRAVNFRANVWAPAVERAWPSKDADGKPIMPALRPRIHDLRHTCASWLIQAGVPLPVVQQHLGHESITTTVDVYGHLDRRSAQAAADAISAALGA
ncbi:site-specific integrase [Mycolicibacterium sp. F2034L]|uniref:tyrosine-type recombinase/integrase n=1 Tax=Mycolicibacterium sp. F2034L TaxID=2926422 RepID=UPI001FF1A0AB|nr:site-specific integrase [Mycolicibacterium sp. F2034L]MCK0174763.1 tyrosine-type recombinase/integrase [Mycolicibacterium sp. F2034L]